MNLLLLRESEVRADGTVKLEGRRLLHLKEVLRVQKGSTVRVGIRGGGIGRAEVVSEDSLALTIDEVAPPRANISLVLAIPRPKQLKRIVSAIASLGVDRVMLVNAARVEKSYFDSKVLAAEFLDELIDLGLEQACDTIPPVFEVRERLRPFVEDELGTWAPADGARIFAHPYADDPISPRPLAEPIVLAIGPDGGWVPFEVELFRAQGFMPVSLGRRVLRGEVAIPTVIGALRAGSL